jgi:hypothetical protein
VTSEASSSSEEAVANKKEKTKRWISWSRSKNFVPKRGSKAVQLEQHPAIQ